MPNRHQIPILLLMFGLVLAACGAETATPTLPPMSDDSIATDDSMSGDSMSDDSMSDDSMAMDDDVEHEGEEEHVYTFGDPAEDSAAERVIDIQTLDTFAFTPDPITVKVGETVTFRFTNDGNLPHDVVLDTAEGQDVHEAEMAEMFASGNMTMMMDEANGFAIQPGESKILTWHFTEAGTVFIGCHQPGHFAAGMVASVIVEP